VTAVVLWVLPWYGQWSEYVSVAFRDRQQGSDTAHRSASIIGDGWQQ